MNDTKKTGYPECIYERPSQERVDELREKTRQRVLRARQSVYFRKWYYKALELEKCRQGQYRSF